MPRGRDLPACDLDAWIAGDRTRLPQFKEAPYDAATAERICEQEWGGPCAKVIPNWNPDAFPR